MTDAQPIVSEDDSAPHTSTTTNEPASADAVTSHGGMKMPRLGFGTWQLEPDAAEEMVAVAIETGYRHIDTAQMYENEAAVGKGIAASGVSPDDLFVTTKVANDHHEPESLRTSVEQSLENLGLDRVDLLLIHWPVEFDRISATMAALANVHAGGLARHIGVSNFIVDQLDEVQSMAPVEVLQVECHPMFRQDELRRWCVDHDWVLTAYSPLARGDVFDSDVITDIAQRHDCTPSAVALAWLTSLDKVSAIPKTTSIDHLRDNWQSQQIELDDEAIAAIEDLDEQRIVDPEFAPW